ncbi:DUF3017 domain-containing protein [Yinghuangia soli]|uniref:DUF3017 domain-containing protein n=1 Tax=Yinghuangia soli TaxID=2908204 RepID=A0AA41Q2C0_9ACTN|nr:DUF3017 domain-containing protein [Yinghuangia soli]MCF2530021.1 DUF3017 domain-containing protein [Yinghuangia soli]
MASEASGRRSPGSGPPAGPGRAATRRAGTRGGGTHLPEGGASPAGPGGLREWPAMLVFGLLTAALLTAAMAGFRPATVLIGVTFAVAAVLRVFVRDVGILAVRSRFTDVTVMLVLGGAVVMLGLMIPPPVVELPWVPRRTG